MPSPNSKRRVNINVGAAQEPFDALLEPGVAEDEGFVARERETAERRPAAFSIRL
jgi:hypothetical protein